MRNHMDVFTKVCLMKNPSLTLFTGQKVLLSNINSILGPNGNSKSSLSRISSRERLLQCNNVSPIVTVMSPQVSSGPSTSDEISEESKSDLRRTNSSSSIVTLGMCNFTLIENTVV